MKTFRIFEINHGLIGLEKCKFDDNLNQANLVKFHFFNCLLDPKGPETLL